jgi:DNA-binding PucR family transcriptional regulator
VLREAEDDEQGRHLPWADGTTSSRRSSRLSSTRYSITPTAQVVTSVTVAAAASGHRGGRDQSGAVDTDERLLAALRHRLMASLACLSPATRLRLAETLRSWLLHMGDRQAVAEELHVHPQTVLYRLAQLREAFGEKLDDPATWASLMLVLASGSEDADLT